MSEPKMTSHVEAVRLDAHGSRARNEIRAQVERWLATLQPNQPD